MAVLSNRCRFRRLRRLSSSLAGGPGGGIDEVVGGTRLADERLNPPLSDEGIEQSLGDVFVVVVELLDLLKQPQ